MIDIEKLIDLFTRYEYETLCVKDKFYKNRFALLIHIHIA